MKSILLLSLFVVALAAPAAGQIVGQQDFVDFPGSQDSQSRVVGFAFNNRYFVAYNDNSNGLSGGEGPAIYSAQITPSNTTPPVLNFQDAIKTRVPGVALDTHLCHMAAAVVEDAPYIFQFKCSRAGSSKLLTATYEKLIPPIAPINTPTFSALGTVPPAMVSQVGNLFGVGSAAIRSKMYLFFLRSTGSKANSISVWSYAGQGSTGPVAESTFTFNGTDATMQDLDATSVTLASGEQAIVVTACYVASGKAQVKAWLFDGTTTTLNPVSLANPPWAQFPASVRIAYGPANGTSKINSCTVFYTAINNGFFSSTTKLYQSQIALPASLQGSLSQSGNWNQIRGIWLNSRGGSQFPNAWSAFPVSVPSKTKTNGYANVYQYITLMECGRQISLHAHDASFVSSLALRLKVDPTTAGEEWDSGDLSNLSDAEIKARVQSWNLLGIITGLPPLPQGTTVTYRAPILQLQYDSSVTGSKQTSKTSVVSAEVSATLPNLTASGTYTYSTKQGTTSSSTVSLDLNQSYHSSTTDLTYDAFANTGFLIVSQPVYLTGHYDVFAYDGTTSLGVSTVAISVDGTSIGVVPFNLDNPSQPVGDQPACIYESFPVDSNNQPLVTYPLTTDIEGWKAPASLTNVAPLFTNIGQQYLDCTDSNSTQLGLTSSQLNSYTGDTSNTIEVGAGITFLGIGTSVENELKFKSQTTVAFATSQTSQITYPQLQPSRGYSAIRLHVIFDKLGTSTTTPANWMPTIFNGSTPWIMTWKVDSSTP